MVNHVSVGVSSDTHHGSSAATTGTYFTIIDTSNNIK